MSHFPENRTVRPVLPRLRRTHRAECAAAERAAMGIPEGLIRYSVGIDESDGLIAELAQAFAAL